MEQYELNEALANDIPTMVKALLLIDALANVSFETKAYKIGFTDFDREMLSSFAQQFHTRGWLSAKQNAVLATRMRRYTSKLFTVGEDERTKSIFEMMVDNSVTPVAFTGLLRSVIASIASSRREVEPEPDDKPEETAKIPMAVPTAIREGFATVKDGDKFYTFKLDEESRKIVITRTSPNETLTTCIEYTNSEGAMQAVRLILDASRHGVLAQIIHCLIIQE
jgi:hypothetical protein